MVGPVLKHHSFKGAGCGKRNLGQPLRLTVVEPHGHSAVPQAAKCLPTWEPTTVEGRSRIRRDASRTRRLRGPNSPHYSHLLIGITANTSLGTESRPLQCDKTTACADGVRPQGSTTDVTACASRRLGQGSGSIWDRCSGTRLKGRKNRSRSSVQLSAAQDRLDWLRNRGGTLILASKNLFLEALRLLTSDARTPFSTTHDNFWNAYSCFTQLSRAQVSAYPSVTSIRTPETRSSLTRMQEAREWSGLLDTA